MALGSFGGLEVPAELVEALGKMGITSPTEVQLQSFPLVLGGQDLLVQSRTGTGKTVAFGLPVLMRLDPKETRVKALVVAPTRELANQVGAVLARLGRSQGLKVAIVTGGVAYADQLRALRQGVQVVVGTPGRLIDHLSRGTMELGACETIVLDEADEILDMGFQEDLEKLLGALPDEHQSLLFSATTPDGIDHLIKKYMRKPVRVGVTTGLEASATLTHQVYEVAIGSKYNALVNLIHTEAPDLALLFCHTKASTEELAKQLVAEGFKAGYLNGDLPQALRTKTLEAFRHHEITLLVATDVAARGIDVRGISHVFNYDIPRGGETYIHRSGRTGRAGREGKVINLVGPLDRAKVRSIAQAAGLKIETCKVPQADEVRRRLRERFFEGLVNRIEANDFEDFRPFALELIENLDPASVVAALLQDVETATGQLAAGYDVEVLAAVAGFQRAKPQRDVPKRAARERTPQGQEEGMVRLRLNVGKADYIQVGYLLRMICARGNLHGTAIGSIKLFLHHTLVDVKPEAVAKVFGGLNGYTDDRGRTWSVQNT